MSVDVRRPAAQSGPVRKSAAARALTTGTLGIGGAVICGAVVMGLWQPTMEYALVGPLWTVLLAGGLLLCVVAGGAWAVSFLQRRREANAYSAGREAERAARRSFAFRLDHELKNPVTAIRAAAIGLVPGNSPDPTVLLDTLDSQTTRLATLVSGLRKLAELETQEIEREDVDVAATIREVVADLDEERADDGTPRRVTVTLPQAPWPLPHVRGDVDLLYLAISNLVSNAVKFSPDDAPIEIRGVDDDGDVVVEVADSGVGIPEHETAMIFEELARGEQARGLPGSGIGLSLVSVIAQRHGGSVTVRSRQSEGTSMRLVLPAASAGGLRRGNTRTTEAPSGRER